MIKRISYTQNKFKTRMKPWISFEKRKCINSLNLFKKFGKNHTLIRKEGENRK